MLRHCTALKQALFVALLAGATPSANAAAPITRSTAKGVEPFARCFAETQERAGDAWWFVPKASGGTFSNLGAKGVAEPYFVDVADKGAVREVRLSSAAQAAVLRAVDRCI